MSQEVETIQRPYRIASKLAKRREGESEPYEVIENIWWHEPDGTEVTDPARFAELEAEHKAREI